MSLNDLLSRVPSTIEVSLWDVAHNKEYLFKNEFMEIPNEILAVRHDLSVICVEPKIKDGVAIMRVMVAGSVLRD